VNKLRVCFFLVVILALLSGCSGPADEINNRAKTTAEHIKSIHDIAIIIEKYKSVTGQYPFREKWEDVPEGYVAVPISAKLTQYELPEQLKYPPPGISGHVIGSDQLESYLSVGIKEPIILPKDDREIIRDGKVWPYFYQFLYDGQNYFVSCYLDEHHPHARKVDENWYKYEVGSVAIPDRKIHLFSADSKPR
jgi:hypothetical protein